MKKTPIQDPQLSFPELTFLNEPREEVFLDQLGQNIRNTKFVRVRLFSSEFDQPVKDAAWEYMTECLSGMAYLFHSISRYNPKHKGTDLGQIIEKATVTPDHILYVGVPNPTPKAELLEWLMKQESRINGFFIAYKDFTKGKENMVRTIHNNLRSTTILIKTNLS